MNRITVNNLLAAVLVWTVTVSNAFAAVISTEALIAGEERSALVSEVQAKLAREDLQEAMIRLGVEPEQASLRVESLSKTELAQLDGQLDSLPAGGDILALIGAVFVVLLILELVGAINVFSGP